MKHLLYAFLFVIGISQCQKKEENYITQFPSKPEVPSAIKKEHTNLLAQIKEIASYDDSTSIVARNLQEILQHHFDEEEDFVLPTLSLLPLLASGDTYEQHKDILPLIRKFKAQLTHMNAEHQMIKAYMADLKQVGAKENHPEILKFEEELHDHAAIEEEIFFPAAILIGEYLDLKSIEK
ncbi:hemerythrin domain-containing protein [Chryseolinea sp. H1M3-3]|uniref:hemerythrin domain-containing protein n=1 Tax=Chryseolinea sp. H1M3-3 TaxID=3034144 RepID=UPI0023EDA123|nr:hemerythrin domain-containing protein [Chryseolinea sp. H1M3-3]